jgi:L-seryl-tRNA(Ser) seleniumtransferase
MLREPVEDVRARAERLAILIGGEVVETRARAGGGALPLHDFPSAAVAVELGLAAALRNADPPVIALVRDDRTLLDARTIADGEVELVAAAVQSCR